MFMLFVTLLLTGLAALAGHLYITLRLQAETVQATCDMFKQEQYIQGMLCYAIATLASDQSFKEELKVKKEVRGRCDLWNKPSAGGIRGQITYRIVPKGYLIEVLMHSKDIFVAGIRAHVNHETDQEKNIYSCVSIETF